jgi:DNA-binding NarL/FixJ family response regulator
MGDAMQAMRIMLVDDHPIVVDTLAMSLRMEGLEVEVAPDLAADAIVELGAKIKPDVVLLDLDLGGDDDSLPVIRPLTEQGARVVMVTGNREPVQLGRCLEEGALGIVSKNVPFARLQEAVLDAVAGRSVMPESERIQLLNAASGARRDRENRLAPFTILTKRETAILGHLMAGQPAEEIAGIEFVSLATVRSQIQSILRKLQVNSQLAAVALAKERGWEPPPS